MNHENNNLKHARRASKSPGSQSSAVAHEDSTASPAQVRTVTVNAAGQEEEMSGNNINPIPELGMPAPYTTSATSPASSASTSPQLAPMRDAAHDIQQCIAGGLAFDGPQIAECFSHAPNHPPVTAMSLAELDISRIINNPKLRQDVNFDRELHFRPNLEGSKGKEKLRQAEEYWKALEGEFYMYAYVQQELSKANTPESQAYWYTMRAETEKRLPSIFHAIREILITLVPDYDQDVVKNRLDAELLMQEIKNGVCDLVDLASWMGRILKHHCAPMRDHLVDRMEGEIKRGAYEGKCDVLVHGIRQLLAILEMMKLDVANHQIRHLRTCLVADAVNYQRRFYAYRIDNNRFDVTRSRLWLDCEIAQLTTDDETPTHLEALTSALLRGMLFYDTTTMYPQTFHLDTDRLRSLRVEMHTKVYQEVCRDILFEAASSCSPPADELIRAAALLRTNASAIAGPSGKFDDRVEHIAAEIMRMVLRMEGDKVQYDPFLLQFVENRLQLELQPGSVLFEKYALGLFEQLLPRLQANVARYIDCDPVQLQSLMLSAAPPAPAQPFGFGAVLAPPPASRSADPLDDILRRFTHIIVLHWQIWHDLVYTGTPDEDQGSSSYGGCRTPPSGPGSPTMPMAEAVYAPGRRFLPIGVTIRDVPTGLPTPAASPSLEAQAKAGHEQGDISEQNPFDRPQAA